MKNIFLIGFMGSGKSTLGKKLASRLGYAFLDMDAELERQEKKSVRELFAEKGEKNFRQLETAWLDRLEIRNAVIATGGGTPCHNDNLAGMKKKGITVYLRSSPENLANRLFDSKTPRPLIDPVKHDLSALQNLVRSLLEEREPFYQSCDLIIDPISMDAAKLDHLTAALKKMGQS